MNRQFTKEITIQEVYEKNLSHFKAIKEKFQIKTKMQHYFNLLISKNLRNGKY